jgi:hypothetical protein
MKFIDPSTYTCPTCGHEGTKAVCEMLTEKAVCDECSASLGVIGKRMNDLVDENWAFHYAVELLMRIEDEHAVIVPDSAVEAVRPWSQIRWITIQEIAKAVQSEKSVSDLSACLNIVMSAFKKEHPRCPSDIDVQVPLLDVIKSSNGRL